jgi:hypothetical protein
MYRPVKLCVQSSDNFEDKSAEQDDFGVIQHDVDRIKRPREKFAHSHLTVSTPVSKLKLDNLSLCLCWRRLFAVTCASHSSILRIGIIAILLHCRIVALWL